MLKRALQFNWVRRRQAIWSRLEPTTTSSTGKQEDSFPIYYFQC